MSAPHAVVGAHAWRTALRRWSRAAAPREACGLLLGEHHGRALRVALALRAHNVADAVDAFEIDAVSVLAAHDLATATRTRIIATWHSHWCAPAQPSTRDRAGAWPDLACVIVGPVQGVPRVRAFALTANGVTPLTCTRIARRRAGPRARDACAP